MKDSITLKPIMGERMVTLGKGTDRAQHKGASDFKRSTKQGALESLINPAYSPPSKYKKPYDNAWKEAKKQHEKK